MAVEGGARPNSAASISEGSSNSLLVVMKPRDALGCSQVSSNLSVLSTVFMHRLHLLECEQAV